MHPGSPNTRVIRRYALKSLRAAAKRRGVVLTPLSDYHIRLTTADGRRIDYWPTTRRAMQNGTILRDVDPIDAVLLLAPFGPKGQRGCA